VLELLDHGAERSDESREAAMVGALLVVDLIATRKVAVDGSQ
jgi:hypothetical protein